MQTAQKLRPNKPRLRNLDSIESFEGERKMAQERTGNLELTIAKSGAPLVWMHIGDLHLTAPELPNHLALRDIILQANAHLARHIDFAVLPGDNTDDGTPVQYEILRSE